MSSASAQALITGNIALSGVIDGGNSSGYYVANGGLLTVNSGTLQNFTTTGGSGSGGGAGLGGAIFIDAGGAAVLNGVSLNHDTAVGGIGGTTSLVGGLLDNGIASGLNPIAPGATGAAGTQYSDNVVYFGDGKGNGDAGNPGSNGANATNGYGGAGGVGGAGTNGWATNPIAIANVATATGGLAGSIASLAIDTSQLPEDLADVASFTAEAADPFEAGVALTDEQKALLASVRDTASILNDTAAVAFNTTNLAVQAAALAAFNNAAAAGTVSNGGSGGTGGNGGAGSYGFGGGPGGEGGEQGSGGRSSNTAGAGGNGGTGGAGGFGGGGGSGGVGYYGPNTTQVPTSTLAAPFNVEALGGFGTGTAGSGGAGGAAGFAAGVGSVGGVGSIPGTGGGGGSGFGGAIFVQAGGMLTLQGDTTFSHNNDYGGTSLNGGVAGQGGIGTDLFMMTGSTVQIAPGAGHIVTFNGTIADDSITSISSASNSVGNGASLTILAGTTVFNGANTYSGQTIITGGALDGSLNTATNVIGAPDYSHTAGALQAADGTGLPTDSLLNFAGPNQFTGGVLETSGTFTRWVGTFNPLLGSNADRIEWTGSGGFAALNGPLTVTLSNNAPLTWGSGNFVPFGSSLMFGASDSTDRVTFTNAFSTTGGTASVVVADNGDANADATLSGIISGSGNLSIDGGGYNGVLNLAAANTYTGTTTINSGTLALTGAGSISHSASLTVNGVFDTSQATSTSSIMTLAGSGFVLLGHGSLNVTAGSTTFAGTLADGGLGGGLGGNFSVSGGTETLTGTNTYTGVTSISRGATLALSGTGSIATSSGVADNGTFDISQNALGASITTLSGLGVANLGSNVLMISNGSTRFDGAISDGGLGGGTGASLVVAGGTQTLTGANTYTGGTMIDSGGTLALSGHGSIAPSAFVNALGTLDISQTTSGAAITTLEGSGTANLGGQTLTISAGAAGPAGIGSGGTFAGTIADGGIGGGTGGNLTLAGGVETLTGTNTYTGATSIAGGATLALANSGSIATSSGVAAFGALDISSTTAGASIATLSGTGQANLGGQTLTFTRGSTTFAGTIADGGFAGGTGGSVAVTGGTQTLSGVETYTGLTTIAPSATGGATLALSGAGSIATSSGVAVAANGVFDASQTTAGDAITTLSGAGGVAMGANTLTITAGGAGAAAATAVGVFSGVLSDGGIGGGTGAGLVVAGGVETFSGVNTYTGGTTIAPATPGGAVALVLTGSGSIATSSNVAIAGNGLFDISGTTSGATIATLADSGPGTGTVFLGSKALSISNGSTAFSGTILDGGVNGGTGGTLTVAGGTQTLAGVNGYTGATTIDAGATLALNGTGSIATSAGVMDAGRFSIAGTTSGASITTLGGAGGVDLGARTLTITAGAAGASGTAPAGVYSGVASGMGGLSITGGHQELTGVNTYTGATNVSNATVSANSGNSFGSLTGQLTLNNATIVADNAIATSRAVTAIGVDTIATNGYAVSFAGNLSGNGTLNANGGGTFALSGTNTGYTGQIAVGQNTALTTSSRAALGHATIALVSPTGAATNLFTGSAFVGGPLDVVNSANPVLYLNTNERLKGNGSVMASVVFRAGSTNAPGDGPATISILGPVMDMPGSIYAVDIDGPTSSIGCANPAGCAGTYSSTVVTGAGTNSTYTAGGTLAPNLRNIGAPANNDYVPPVTSHFTIVQAQGGVFGSFATLIQPAAGLPASTRFDALYTPNAITLYVTPAAYQNLTAFGVNETGNQNQVAAALDGLRGPAGVRNNAAVTSIFGTLFAIQPANLPPIFDSLSGEATDDAKFGALRFSSQFLDTLLDPTRNRKAGAAIGIDRHWTIWASALGGSISAGGDPAIGSHSVRSAYAGGVATGADYQVNADTMLGFAVAGGGTSWSVSQGLGGGDGSAFQGGVYGSTHYGAIYVAGAAAGADHFFSTNRTAAGVDQLKGDFSGQTYGGRLESGYRIPVSLASAISPYGAIEVQRFATPGHSEIDTTGTGFALAYQAANVTDVREEIGARLDSVVVLQDGLPLLLNLRAAYAHDGVSDPGLLATFVAASQPGAAGAAVPFVVNGAPLPHDSALVDAGAELRWTETMSFALNGDFEKAFARSTQIYGGSGTVRWVW